MTNSVENVTNPRHVQTSVVKKSAPAIAPQCARRNVCHEARPLTRDQVPIPSQHRVWRDHRRDLTEATTAEPVSVPRQPSAFLIGEAEPATQLSAEDAVFFDEVGHGLPLPLVEPADQRGQEPLEGRRVDPAGSLYHGPI